MASNTSFHEISRDCNNPKNLLFIAQTGLCRYGLIEPHLFRDTVTLMCSYHFSIWQSWYWSLFFSLNMVYSIVSFGDRPQSAPLKYWTKVCQFRKGFWRKKPKTISHNSISVVFMVVFVLGLLAVDRMNTTDCADMVW